MTLQAIKVSDLLNQVGAKDTIELRDIDLDDVALHPDHLIQGYLDLWSLSADRISATFREIECGIESVCDHCGKTFIRPIRVDEYSCTFAADTHAVSTDDEIFGIDSKENIHIDEPLRQAILLDTPVAVHCIDCINDDSIQTDAVTPDEIDEVDYSDSGGTVVFR